MGADETANSVTGERGADHGHGSSYNGGEYMDPHGHHDVDPEYIKKFVEENEEDQMTCLDMCKALQDMNIDAHHAQIFCYDAAEHGWLEDMEKPKWEVRMEVRCQEGHWAERMAGFRAEEDEQDARKRRDDDYYDDLSYDDSERGKGKKNKGKDKEAKKKKKAEKKKKKEKAAELLGLDGF